MSAGVTRISDMIVPEIFSSYSQQLTQQKSRLIQSGAFTLSADLAANLSNGGGLTFNEPSYRDLDDDEENVSSDDPTVKSSPNGIHSAQEVQVRLSRNNSWSTMDLTRNLTGNDPANAIANRVADYWVRRLQRAFIATVNGVFAANAAAPSANSTHVQNDMVLDISGAAYSAGMTTFSAEAFLDCAQTMGDSADSLSMVMMHSIVYNRALKNNLIDFLVDSSNGAAIRIPTFLGREVIVDDSMPSSGGLFDTWLFGSGAFVHASGMPKVPTEIHRDPSSGNGSGQETMFNRVEWVIHPVGYAYAGKPPMGGPSNASTTNNLAAATSWDRAFTERKQIPMARLVTREFAST